MQEPNLNIVQFLRDRGGKLGTRGNQEGKLIQAASVGDYAKMKLLLDAGDVIVECLYIVSTWLMMRFIIYY